MQCMHTTIFLSLGGRLAHRDRCASCNSSACLGSRRLEITAAYLRHGVDDDERTNYCAVLHCTSWVCEGGPGEMRQGQGSYRTAAPRPPNTLLWSCLGRRDVNG